jgi:hypothetical protein
MMKKQLNFLPLVVVILAVTVPYLAAAQLGGPEYRFTGFLFNPQDGATYLAKMSQGLSGSWRFTLPYTAEPGNGAYLFLFYLSLGHLAGFTGLPLVLIFHLARIISVVLLVLALGRFFDHVFRLRPAMNRPAYWLALFGAGMGWLVVFSGSIPADFWIAEAYPFLSMLQNPHFPLGLALILWSFCLLIEKDLPGRYLQLAVVGLLISIILPFGIVVVVLVFGVVAAANLLEYRRLDWLPVFFLGSLGGPFLLYQFWAIQSDPVLAGWNAQNVTLTPPVWDVLLSFSPVLLLAVYASVQILRSPAERAHLPVRLMLAWLVLGLVLMYSPFSLQRRFMLGFYIPAAALAGIGIDMMRQAYPRLAGRLVMVVFLLAIPTNLLLLAIGTAGAASRPPQLYLSHEEDAALAWIRDNTPRDALILASPEMGLFIPAYTGRRVIYGHPFETVNADQEKETVIAFFAESSWQSRDPGLLEQRKVDYIFFGPREQGLRGSVPPEGMPFPQVFSSGQVQIYLVKENE